MVMLMLFDTIDLSTLHVLSSVLYALWMVNQLKIAGTNFCDRVQQRLDFYQMKIQ
jgi:hypothetical protein